MAVNAQLNWSDMTEKAQAGYDKLKKKADRLGPAARQHEGITSVGTSPPEVKMNKGKAGAMSFAALKAYNTRPKRTV
jgi:hypothetical protein